MAGTVITNKGLQLIAKLVASGTALAFTRASVGTGSVPAGYDPGSMTSLNNYKMDGVISSCSSSGDEASIVMQVSSIGVSTGFTITEVGLFATDPDDGEILYSYLDLTKDPQYIYAANSAISKFVEMTLMVKIGTVEKVTAYLNPNSLVTRDGDISETVIETLETTEDKYPIPAAGETMKVFAGKVRTFVENTKPLESDTSYYVSATTGSDTTGDGSISSPYASITKALSIIPKDLGGYTAAINISDGTYAEDVIIQGISNGYLRIQRNGVQELNDLCNVKSIRVENCNSVSISGLNLTIIDAPGIFGTRTDFINVQSCQSISNADTQPSFNFDYVSVVRISGSRSLNHYSCLRSYDSHILSESWSNDSMAIQYGIDVNGGGRISKGNTFQPKGTISNVYYAAGSVIVNQFGASIGTLRYNLTLYVATTGSDTSGNGTSNNPFATIQYALDIIPKDLGGYTATINIADGTYNEIVYIYGYHSGTMDINSSNITALSTVCQISGISIKDCSARVQMRGLCLTYTGGDALLATNCSFVYVSYCQTIASATSQYGFDFVYSNAYITNCRVSNRNIGMRSLKSNVTSINWSSDGVCTSYGLSADTGGSICKVGTQPTGGIRSEWQGGSGMFVNPNGTQISDIISSGLSCTWGTITGGYVRHGNAAGGVAMVTLNLVITTTVSLNAGQTYTVNGLIAPPVSIAVSSNAPSTTQRCSVDGNTLNVAYTSAKSIGSVLEFSATYLTNS